MVMRGATAARTRASLTREKTRVRVAGRASLLALGLVLGLGSCAARTPANASAESATNTNAQPGVVVPESALGSQHCSSGTADCDGNADNACEAVLANDPKNCGACGVQCAGANGESACFSGTCRMVRCIPGHCDLDGDPKNGCEARTKGCRVNRD